MTFIDLTHTLKNNFINYPGDPDFKIEYFETIKDNDCNISKICGSPHTGTHIDSPYHYVENNQKIDQIKLENLIGKTSVLEIENIEPRQIIEISNIKKFPKQLEKLVILKTNWCKNWGSKKYFYDNPSISNELIDILVKNKIYGIATDMSSVDFYGETKNHKRLLKNNIWICENLTNTNKIKTETCTSYFIPLKINEEASLSRCFIKPYEDGE